MAGWQIFGISLSSAAHIAVLLDKENKPLRNAILWLDQRSHGQAARLAEGMGSDILDITKNQVSSTWTLPHLLWIKEEDPLAWQKTRSILLSKDYAAFFLTGIKCTDPATAVSSMLYDVQTESWSSKLCSMAGVNPDFLPEIRPVTARVGTLTPEAARILGLKAGIPVINGTLDSTAETFCAKASASGDLAIRLASAGGVHLLVDCPCPHPKLITYPYPLTPHWLIQAGTNSCASAIQWACKSMTVDNEISFDAWDASAAEAGPGAEGLVFHPYLSGERCPYWDNRLRASFTGLSFQHNLPHIARAVYEGCTFSIKDAMAMLSTFSGKAESVSLIGGGAKSKLWSSIVCNVLGVDIVRTPEVDSSYGAALLGLYGLGVYTDIRDAQRCAHFGGEHMIPDKETHILYQSIFRIYLEIQQAMQPIYHEWPA